MLKTMKFMYEDLPLSEKLRRMQAQRFTSHSYTTSLCFLYYRIVISKESSFETREGAAHRGVQVSPTSERRVHYCSALNLFVVYRRRAAKWYPILWYPYVVYRASIRRRGKTLLRMRHMLLHHVAHCRGATPALR